MSFFISFLCKNHVVANYDFVSGINESMENLDYEELEYSIGDDSMDVSNESRAR